MAISGGAPVASAHAAVRWPLRSMSEVLHPLDSALAATLTVPPGAVSWTLYQLTHDLLGSPVDLEGLSLQLNSPSGRQLLLSRTENG